MIANSPSTDATMDRALSFMDRTFGFSQFRPGQREILAAVLEESDVLGIMPTGAGKSLCYQVPAFTRSGMTLVISPLIALMKDQVDTLRVLDLPVASIHSLMTLREQEETLGKVASGEIKLLYVSPERLRNPRFLEALGKRKVTMVAVDEAHCISQWGHDFRPDYLRIKEALKALGRPQTIALTATAPERVRTDIIEHLELQAPRLFIAGFDRRNLFWEVVAVERDQEKLELIRERVTDVSGAVIVYTGTRKNVEQIVRRLRKHGILAWGYHAGMDQEERLRVQETFMEGRSNLVVATNAFGMGIDRSDIRMVIHHTFPGSIEAYYQESGRAGRDGDPATCLLLYTPKDRHLQEFFIQARYPDRRAIWEVYDRVRKRGEDVLWLTYREIGMMGEEKIPEMAVGSCLKILEEAGAVQRLHRYDNQAELYLYQDISTLLGALPARAKNRKALLQYLARAYENAELEEGIQFLPEELAERTGLSVEALRRSFAQMEAHSQVSYIPPFRGRGLRILRRTEPEKLPIDFEALQIRKAYELTRLDQVMAYAGSKACRRKYLLQYFGERVEADNCGACDICVKEEVPKLVDKTPDDPLLAIKILSGVARLKGRFGTSMAAKVLTGSRDRVLLGFGLDRLSTYGLLSDTGQAQVQEWIKELISLGFLASHRIPMGNKTYPVLEITPKGHEIMRNKEVIALSPPRRLQRSAAQPPSAMEASEAEVFNRLRELRMRLARKEGLPPYCIFQDRTLREMARTLPSTKEALSGIVGVGEVTLRKYGDAFLVLLDEIRGEKRE